MNIIRHQRRRCHKNTGGKNELGKKKGKLTEEENQMCCLRPRVMVISWQQQSQEKEKEKEENEEEKQKVMTHMRR